jgi:hypothetical protein
VVLPASAVFTTSITVWYVPATVQTGQSEPIISRSAPKLSNAAPM